MKFTALFKTPSLITNQNAKNEVLFYEINCAGNTLATANKTLNYSKGLLIRNLPGSPNKWGVL